ncbi:MAG TPA: hypothetical protein VJB13_01605 [Candidatus Nanoarchaeia archaeon]|nr:hypothetical protein [Candidatus Nanoarchaeia archaeon]
MVLTTPGNDYRDAVYKKLFNHIQSSLAHLSEASYSREYFWDSEIAQKTDEIATKNKYRLSRRSTPAPALFVIGYQQNSPDHTLAFLSELGENSILEQCVFLAEGYDQEAAMLSKIAPVTNNHFNTLFRKCNLKPRGRDSFPLRERQYKNFADQNLRHNEKKLLETVDCLVRRERDHFLPSFLEEEKQGKPMIFLANIIHLASATLPTQLSNNGIGYAFFVPRYNK